MTEFRSGEKLAATSLELNQNTLTERFGEKVFAEGITRRGDLAPFFKISNQILPSVDTPQRTTHMTSWEFWHNFGHKSRLATVRLYDSFPLPVSKKRGDEIKTEIVDELQKVHYENRVGPNLPPRLKELSDRLKNHEGWGMDPVYSFDPLDGQHWFGVGLEKKIGETKAVIELELTFSPELTIKIPVTSDFEEVRRECQEMGGVMAKWLGLPFAPLANYEFSMQENAKDEPAKNATSFPQYFFEVLDYWKSYKGEKELRALIGKSDEGEPILLLEDPSLSFGNRRLNSDMVLFGGRSVDFSFLTLGGHPAIWDVFNNAVRERVVNQSLAEKFPGRRYDDADWLHMFVFIDENGQATLREDVPSNTGKEKLRPYISKVEGVYGISYGGLIDRQIAERAAREVMFMPRIIDDAAKIQERYGLKEARRFKGLAVSALVNGDIHAQEKYEALMKLI